MTTGCTRSIVVNSPSGEREVELQSQDRSKRKQNYLQNCSFKHFVSMIVSQEQYEKMKEVVAKIVQEGRNVKVADCSQVQCDFEALVSLLSQALVRQNKFSNSSRQMILKKLEAGQREGVSLLNLSHQVGIGSYRTAKFVVESILGSNCSVSQIVENPDLITDEWIRREVLECILHDPSCSVDTTLTQECVGREYEVLLMQQLRSRNMCFETEAELRNRGKPKTPDILLLIPMGVIDYQIPIESSNRISGVFDVPRISTSSSAVKQNVSTIAEGTQQQQRHYVINWIDSKAMFADEETFEGNYEQLKGYVNRYNSSHYDFLSLSLLCTSPFCSLYSCLQNITSDYIL